MTKNNEGKTGKRTLSPAQRRAMIARKTAERANDANKSAASVKPKRVQMGKGNNVGKVYRGRTKYIDTENKLERDYVVVRDDGRSVTVSKLKSIKKTDKDGRNTDPALVEINYKRYGLEKRTGVDFERFSKNRMSKRPLRLSDKRVFPEGKERFTLSNRDRDKALFHTGIRKRRQKNRSN